MVNIHLTYLNNSIHEKNLYTSDSTQYQKYFKIFLEIYFLKILNI